MASSDYYLEQVAAAVGFAAENFGAEVLVLIQPNGERRDWSAQVSEGVDEAYQQNDGQIGTAARVMARRPIMATGLASTAGDLEERSTKIERADGRRWTVTKVLRQEGEMLSLYAI